MCAIGSVAIGDEETREEGKNDEKCRGRKTTESKNKIIYMRI